jgi:hypothetical protein
VITTPKRNLRLSILSFGLSAVALTANCGGRSFDALRCGQGTDIAFGFQVLTGGTASSGGPEVMYENGVEFLLVDHSCRYFAYYQTDDWWVWSDVRTGVLTEAELATLNRNLYQADWATMAREFPASFSEPRLGSYLWTENNAAYCGYCTGPLGDFSARAAELTRQLYARGDVQIDPPMRWEVIEQPTDKVEAYPTQEWNAEPPLSEVSVSAYPPDGGRNLFEALKFGDHPLVPDSASGHLRDLRAQFRPTIPKKLLNWMPILDENLFYAVYVRDTLPFENEHGLVRPPGVDTW